MIKKYFKLVKNVFETIRAHNPELKIILNLKIKKPRCEEKSIFYIFA